MGSSDVNNTPKEYGFVQSIRHRDGWYNWYSEEVEPKFLDQLWKTQVGHIT